MDSITQAHARLLTDQTIQFRLAPASAPPPMRTIHLDPSGLDAPWLVWVVVGLAALGVVSVVLRELRARRGRKPGPTQPAAAPASVALPADALADADMLAASGAYGEAVHALLLRSIRAIEQAFPRTLIASYTGREIGRLPILPEGTRRPLAEIAACSERAVFAGRKLSREDWQACRALYRELLGGTSRP